jgi:hypothetical protein
MNPKILKEFEKTSKSIGASALAKILKDSFNNKKAIIYSKYEIDEEIKRACFKYSQKLNTGEL